MIFPKEISQLAARKDMREHLSDFNRKASRKGHNPSDFLEKTLKKETVFKRDWEKKLTTQINDLPPFETVFREAKRHFKF
jgi:hypothetical protein